MRPSKLAFLMALLALSALLIFSCARRPPEEEVIYEEPGLEEFPEEEIVEEEIVEEIPPPPPAETVGYRVQIGAFRNETGQWGGAEQWASQARMRFTESVYVEFEGGLYKVRVGDCVSRSDAEMLKSTAMQLGYGDAFIVETTVTPGGY